MSFNPATVTSAFGYQDGFQTTLSAAITSVSQLAIDLTDLPTPSEGTLVIAPGTDKEEEIYYTSKGTGVVNVPDTNGRGVNGTAYTHDSNTVVKMLWTKASADALKYGGAMTQGSIDNLNLSTTSITLGSSTIESDFSTTTVNSDVDVTNLTVTITIPDGWNRSVRISAFAQDMRTDASGVNSCKWKIKEGSNVLAFSWVGSASANARLTSFVSTAPFVPTAGSHTYKVSIEQVASSGTMYISATATSKAFITVEAL